MQDLEYRDPKQEGATNWLARISWIYGVLLLPVVLCAAVASPFIALDYGRPRALSLLLIPPCIGLALALRSTRGLASHENNAYIVKTRREAEWGRTLNGFLMLISLVAWFALTARSLELQENRDSAASTRHEVHAIDILRACEDYASKNNGNWPPSITALLQSGSALPSKLTLNAENIPLLQRAAAHDPAVSEADVEHAIGFQYLGTGSGIHNKLEKSGDEVVLIGLFPPLRGQVIVGWGDGSLHQVDPANLDKPLPIMPSR